MPAAKRISNPFGVVLHQVVHLVNMLEVQVLCQRRNVRFNVIPRADRDTDTRLALVHVALEGHDVEVHLEGVTAVFELIAERRDNVTSFVSISDWSDKVQRSVCQMVPLAGLL